MGGSRWLAAVLVGAALSGCARPPSPADLAELEQVKRENAALSASLEVLGARLIEGQSRVHADAELKDRHAHVSQVACENLASHWAGINRFLDNQRDKERRRRASRVASAEHAIH